MNRHFNYPVNLHKAKEGGYLIEFPDLPEAITQGNSIEEALNEAADCLEEAIANRMIMKLDIPKPSKPKKSKNLARAFELLTQLPEDFFAEGREDMPPQER